MGSSVCGTFGSGIMLTVEQHQKVTQSCIDQAKKHVPCIVHVGSTSTDISMTLAKNAKAAGADVVSAVPTFYYKYNNAAMVAHDAVLVRSVKSRCSHTTTLRPQDISSHRRSRSRWRGRVSAV